MKIHLRVVCHIVGSQFASLVREITTLCIEMASVSHETDKYRLHIAVVTIDKNTQTRSCLTLTAKCEVHGQPKFTFENE